MNQPMNQPMNNSSVKSPPSSIIAVNTKTTPLRSNTLSRRPDSSPSGDKKSSPSRPSSEVNSAFKTPLKSDLITSTSTTGSSLKRVQSAPMQRTSPPVIVTPGVPDPSPSRTAWKYEDKPISSPVKSINQSIAKDQLKEDEESIEEFEFIQERLDLSNHVNVSELSGQYESSFESLSVSYHNVLSIHQEEVENELKSKYQNDLIYWKSLANLSTNDLLAAYSSNIDFQS
jgi:hypothetical protein